jgi:hypothetical protein
MAEELIGKAVAGDAAVEVRRKPGVEVNKSGCGVERVESGMPEEARRDHPGAPGRAAAETDEPHRSQRSHKRARASNAGRSPLQVRVLCTSIEDAPFDMRSFFPQVHVAVLCPSRCVGLTGTPPRSPQSSPSPGRFPQPGPRQPSPLAAKPQRPGRSQPGGRRYLCRRTICFKAQHAPTPAVRSSRGMQRIGVPVLAGVEPMSPLSKVDM